MSRTRFLIALSIVGALVSPLRAAPPAGFQNETLIASGLGFPTGLEFLPDQRMLICEFGGRVVVVQPGVSAIDPVPVLQLANVFNENVTAGGERGLVNVIADPAFASNGYIYLFYTAGSPQRDRVSRFTMVANTASLASEVVLWQGVSNSNHTDHHGGGLAFGPDGKLYIATGDNGDPASSQSLSSDHGKLLRINPDGTVPADNPFYDGAGSNIDAIWARGLRNPFRISLDAPTGRMFIGDVGQSSVEEINLAARGANYGWPLSEGPGGDASLTNPVFSYPHAGSDAGVIGGFVYRGSQFPTAYQGVYFYADFAKNWLRYLTLNAVGNVTGSVSFEPANGNLDEPSVGDPVMLKPGPDGSLYYLDLGLSWSGGGLGGQHAASVRRIRYSAGNQPPNVSVSAIPVSGPAPLNVTFSSSGSSDPEGLPLTYAWTFGDGGNSTAANPSHAYSQEGLYLARLTVSDGVHPTLSDVIAISVGNAPTGVITSPANGLAFRAGDTIFFSGAASDLEDGNLPAGAFSWTVRFHHDSHVHPVLGPLAGATSGSFVVPVSGHTFEGDTSYEIILTVTDSDGLRHESSVFVFPEKVNLIFNSVPSGLKLRIDGIDRVTPYVRDEVIDFQVSLEALDQSGGAGQYRFLSWSDGGARSHSMVVPAVGRSYTANFELLPTPAGLVTGLGFNEGSGTVAADASGANHPGTLVNGPVWNPGRFGGGISLDGVNDHVVIGSPSSINLGTGDFTLAVWLRREASGSEHTILSKTANTSWTTAGKEWFINGANSRVAFGAFGVGEVYSTGTIANDGQWHHVAVTFQNTPNTVTFYLDGVASGGGTLNLPADNSAHVIKLGGHPAGHYFRGALDELRIYSRALSAAEIAADRNTPVGGGSVLSVGDTAKVVIIKAPVAGPALAIEQTAATHELALRMAGDYGSAFGLEASTDLVHWTLLGVFPVGEAVVPYVDHEILHHTQRFYRLRSVSPTDAVVP